MLSKFIKDIAVYAPSQFLPALTAFITTPILTRLFSPAEYGYWALASGICSFLVALTMSGFGSAAIRYYPAYKARSALRIFFASLFVSVGALTVFVMLACFLIVLLFRKYFPSPFDQLLPLLIFLFAAQGIFSILMALLRAQGRSASFTSFQLFTNYGGLGIGLLLVVLWRLRVEGLLWGSLAALMMSLPFLIFQATKGVGIQPRNFQMADALDVWHYAWPLAVGNMAMWGLRVSDLFIIGLYRPTAEVGFYSVSYNISARSIELIIALFLLSVSPFIYSTWESEGRDTTEKAVTLVTRVYLLLCLPAVIGLTVLSLPFVSILTTLEYYEGHKIVGLVAFASFMWGLSNIAMLGITIKKQARRLAANQIMAAAVHIGLQFLLVPRFGYIASALSTMVGYITLFLLQTWTSRPYLTWRFPFRALGNIVIASGVMGLAAWSTHQMTTGLRVSAPISLVLSISVAVPVFLFCLWLLGEIREDDKASVLQLWSRVKGRAA